MKTLIFNNMQEIIKCWAIDKKTEQWINVVKMRLSLTKTNLSVQTFFRSYLWEIFMKF